MKPGQKTRDAQREALRQVIDWNARFQPGQVIVEYRSHPEAPARPHKTASPAFVLCDHTPCVVLAGRAFKGRGGVVSLDDCRVVAAKADAKAADELAAALGLERPAHLVRQQKLLERLRSLVLEADLCRAELVAAAGHEPDRPLFELTAAARQAGRRYERLAQACFDLELTATANPTNETS